MAVSAETCTFCHNTSGGLNGVSVNQNIFHDAAGSNALYKGSITINSVTWTDETTTVYPTVTFTVSAPASDLDTATAPTAASFAMTAAKKVLSNNAAGNYQFQALLLSGANPSSANCTTLTGSNPFTCVFSGTRKISKTAFDPFASGAPQIELGIQLQSGLTIVNSASGSTIPFVANGSATFSGGGATPIENDRVVVTTTGCNACHGKLQVHGRRVEAQYCTTCHTAQIATGGVPGNGNFSYMVHGLHAAGQMGLNYSIAGVVGAEITYPQDVRNCTTCHVAGQTGSAFY